MADHQITWKKGVTTLWLKHAETHGHQTAQVIRFTSVEALMFIVLLAISALSFLLGPSLYI